MTRIYHPWDVWEDYKHNFYGGVKNFRKEKTLEKYAALLQDLKAFEQALIVITDTWKYSCEHNLSNESMNRIAYLGQAAMALVFNVPHNVCMGGFNLLTAEEQKAADAMAQKYLDIWIRRQEDVNTKKV